MSNYEKNKSEFYKLQKLNGGDDPEDFCGGYCNTEQFFKLLEAPSKATASKIYKELVDKFSDQGLYLVDIKERK
jgi:hypothetical protein